MWQQLGQTSNQKQDDQHPDLILIGEFCEQRGPTPLHLFSANRLLHQDGETQVGEAARDVFGGSEASASTKSGRAPMTMPQQQRGSQSKTSSSYHPSTWNNPNTTSSFEALHAEATQHFNTRGKRRRQSVPSLHEQFQPGKSSHHQHPYSTSSSPAPPPPATMTLKYWKPLVTRILSSDHSSSVAAFPYVSLSSHFYLTHEGYDVYCMLLTFRDLYARGFSRPVCICYISQQASSSKILSQFYHFTVAFENVAKILQYGNYYQFLRDLSREISVRDLNNVDEVTKTEILDDLRDVRRRFESYLNDPRDSLEDPIQDIVCAMTLHEDWARTALPADFLKLLSKGLQVSPQYLTELMPNIMDQMHKRKGYETELRRISYICRSTFSNATTMMCKHILKFFSRSARVLELERDDLEIIDQKPLTSLLFVGQSLMMDFDLDACQSKRKLKPHLLSATTGRTASAFSSMTSFTTANSLPPSGSSWNSSNDPHSVSTGSIMETASEASDISSDINDSLSSEREDQSGSAGGAQRGENSTPQSALLLYNNVPHSATHSQNSSRSNSSSRLGTNGVQYRYNHLSRPEKKYYIFKGDFTGSYSPSVFPDARGSSLKHVQWDSGEMDEEYSILDFVLTFSFSIHLIYSLLMGRLTIITATPEREHEVRQIVRNLSIFLPGQFWDQCSERGRGPGSSSRKRPQDAGILEWWTKNISLKEMQAFRIIGLCKPAIVPRQLRNSVTIMDIEKHCLRAPRYQGRFLEPICALAPLLVDKESFIAHIHAVLLEIGRQAVVHMHAFTLPNAAPNSPPTLRDLSGSGSMSGSSSRVSDKSHSIKKFFAEISPCDMEIVENFVDTVSMQHTSSMMNNLMPTPIKLKRDPVMDFH